VSGAAVRIEVGTRFAYDGEVVEVVEMAASAAGNEVVLRDGRSWRHVRAFAAAQVAAPSQVFRPKRPVGAENSIQLRDLRVFMDQPTEHVAAANASAGLRDGASTG